MKLVALLIMERAEKDQWVAARRARPYVCAFRIRVRGSHQKKKIDSRKRVILDLA